jgi:prepilin-type N-terminal cleavage/methylation domain-containing protein
MQSFLKKTYQLFSSSTDFKKVVEGKFIFKLTHKDEAFTLVELIVSVAIIAIITAIVMFNQNNMSEQISLTNLVTDISLQIRQAQVYGISVKEFSPQSIPLPNAFTNAYGVDFSLNNAVCSTYSPALNPGCGFYIFADLNSNGYYNSTCPPGPLSECITWSIFPQGNYIKQLCVIQGNGASICTLKRLAITFLRPSPVAQMVFWDSTGAQNAYSGYQGGEIVVTSPHGLTQTIVVWQTGQISVSATTL